MKLLFTLLGMMALCQVKSNNHYTNMIASIDTPLLVHRCNDFTVTGKGEAAEWQKANWINLHKIDEGGKEYDSRFKILYSAKGIYVLFSGEDDRITTTYENDFDDLFNADVFEVFFHPDKSVPAYFEYEISPLDKELVLLILNTHGKFAGWAPWHYTGDKRVVKKVSITGGEMKPGAAIKHWNAELFFPYQLLDPLHNVPPNSGMRWYANFCRLDYDSGKMIKWSWAPVKVSFHEFENYLPILFE